MWRFARATAAGASHVRTGAECQDRIDVALTRDGWLVVAVSDGAGSASHGADGAAVAASAFVAQTLDSLRSNLPLPDVVRAAAMHARNEILTQSDLHERCPREFACTLLGLVHDGSRGAACQIGDGLIAVNDGGDAWSWVFWPQRGEYANTTFFLTDESAENLLSVDAVPGPIFDVGLLSDGLEPLALRYADKAVHDPFFKGLLEPIVREPGEGELATLSSQLTAFISSPKVQARTDDDVSLFIATRRPRG